MWPHPHEGVEHALAVSFLLFVVKSAWLSCGQWPGSYKQIPRVAILFLKPSSQLIPPKTAVDKSLDEDKIMLEVQQEDFLSALHSLTPSITPQELAKYKNINTKLSWHNQYLGKHLSIFSVHDFNPPIKSCTFLTVSWTNNFFRISTAFWESFPCRQQIYIGTVILHVYDITWSYHCMHTWTANPYQFADCWDWVRLQCPQRNVWQHVRKTHTYKKVDINSSAQADLQAIADWHSVLHGRQAFCPSWLIRIIFGECMCKEVPRVL